MPGPDTATLILGMAMRKGGWCPNRELLEYDGRPLPESTLINYRPKPCEMPRLLLLVFAPLDTLPKAATSAGHEGKDGLSTIREAN